MSSEERAKSHEEFLLEEGVIVVATIAFGMGINKVVCFWNAFAISLRI
jgi:ATP-dependent DNA helicase RecQ